MANLLLLLTRRITAAVSGFDFWVDESSNLIVTETGDNIVFKC